MNLLNNKKLRKGPAVNAMQHSLLKCAVVAGCIALLGSNAEATSQTFVPQSGDSASATFVTSLNTLTITLDNLQADPHSVADCLSALGFSVSAGSSISETSSSGSERTVNGDGSFSNGSSGVAAGWVLSGTTSSALLDVLAGTGHAGPAHTLIGAPKGSTGVYSDADGSITGNGPHNPFLYGDLTFTLTIMGLTSDSTVGNVFFQWGTTDGQNRVPGIPSVPDGGTTIVLLGSAMIGAYVLRGKLVKV